MPLILLLFFFFKELNITIYVVIVLDKENLIIRTVHMLQVADKAKYT